jgi:hypothetical protein
VDQLLLQVGRLCAGHCRSGRRVLAIVQKISGRLFSTVFPGAFVDSALAALPRLVRRGLGNLGFSEDEHLFDYGFHGLLVCLFASQAWPVGEAGPWLCERVTTRCDFATLKSMQPMRQPVAIVSVSGQSLRSKTLGKKIDRPCVPRAAVEAPPSSAPMRLTPPPHPFPPARCPHTHYLTCPHARTTKCGTLGACVLPASKINWVW